jgi:hypothetical protein
VETSAKSENHEGIKNGMHKLLATIVNMPEHASPGIGHPKLDIASPPPNGCCFR